MASIGHQISPMRSSRQMNDQVLNLTPAPESSRFKTPIARMPDREEDEPLLPQRDETKYLNTSKIEKETIKDYIGVARVMLRKNLTNEARKRDLSEVSEKYKKEVKALNKAKEAFEEDHQRFITMKADLDSIT